MPKFVKVSNLSLCRSNQYHICFEYLDANFLARGIFLIYSAELVIYHNIINYKYVQFAIFRVLINEAVYIYIFIQTKNEII